MDEQIKSVLQYINAHRDGCIGAYVQEHFGLTKDQLIDLFKKMFEQKLISFANVIDEDVTENDLFESMVIITGGYGHPDYSDIY